MSVVKIIISIDQSLLKRVDSLVKAGVFLNRSNVIEAVLEQKMARGNPRRLARECAKLCPTEEQALADEGIAAKA